LQVLQRQMPRLGDSMVVGSLWAFAVAGVLPSGLFQEGLLKLASLPADKARPLLLLQLFQAITLLQVRVRLRGFYILQCLCSCGYEAAGLLLQLFQAITLLQVCFG
jgi:hypothetical protein